MGKWCVKVFIVRAAALCCLLAVFPVASLESVSVSTKPELVFGYSTDASPVSSENAGLQQIEGFCRDVYLYLERSYALKKHPIETLAGRFEHFAESLDGKAGIQCGPSSRTDQREKELQSDYFKSNDKKPKAAFSGEFTDVFFTTNTKILIKKEKIAALYAGGKIKAGIANMKSVTNSSITTLFPHLELKDLKRGRAEGLERLGANVTPDQSIDAYIGDAIILAYIQENYLKEGYSIEPPLSNGLHENYVLVVYNADKLNPHLVADLNQWLDSDPDAQVAKDKLAESVETDSFTRTLTAMLVWLNRSDHLELVRWGLLATALLGMVGMALVVWWLRRKFLSSPQNTVARFEQDERNHFASELHNQTNQLIITAKRSVELGLIQLSRNNDAHQQTFASTLPILDQAVDEIRRLSMELRNPLEDKLDALLKALKSRTGVDVKNTSNILWKDLPETITKTLYPLIQEALHNVERYANANLVGVGVKRIGRQLQIEVRDNGRGFDAARLLKSNGGNGLKLMQNNIEKLGGKCQISSTPGHGTLIKATIPL